MPDRPDQLSDRSPVPDSSAVDDVQGIAFGVTMAALGMHILTHMGFVTGQTTGLAVLIAHATGLPFPADLLRRHASVSWTCLETDRAALCPADACDHHSRALGPCRRAAELA